MIFLTAEGTEESAEVAERLEYGIAFFILVLKLVLDLNIRRAFGVWDCVFHTRCQTRTRSEHPQRVWSMGLRFAYSFSNSYSI